MIWINSSVFSCIRDFNLVFIRNTILISVFAVIYLDYIFFIISANCKIICFCKRIVVNRSFAIFTDDSIIEFCIFSFITFQYFITILINMLDCVFLICFFINNFDSILVFHSDRKAWNFVFKLIMFKFISFIRVRFNGIYWIGIIVYPNFLRHRNSFLSFFWTFKPMFYCIRQVFGCLIIFFPLCIQGNRSFYCKFITSSIARTFAVSSCIPSIKFVTLSLWKVIDISMIFYSIFITCYCIFYQHWVKIINIWIISNFNWYFLYIAIYMWSILILFFYRVPNNIIKLHCFALVGTAFYSILFRNVTIRDKNIFTIHTVFICNWCLVNIRFLECVLTYISREPHALIMHIVISSPSWTIPCIAVWWYKVTWIVIARQIFRKLRAW